MTQQIEKLPRGAQPALWWMNQLLYRYASAELYEKFVTGGFKLTDEIKKEWKEVYMEGIQLTSMGSFLEFVGTLESPYKALYSKRKEYIHFRDLSRYLIPITAPKFSEQFDDDLQDKIERIVR